MDLPEHTPAPPPPTAPASLPDDEPLGGEPPCWAHLLDDEGRMPDSDSSAPRSS